MKLIDVETDYISCNSYLRERITFESNAQTSNRGRTGKESKKHQTSQNLLVGVLQKEKRAHRSKNRGVESIFVFVAHYYYYYYYYYYLALLFLHTDYRKWTPFCYCCHPL
jgi:hypothetical protein